MITVNDNSVPQINAALLRLESGITQGIGSQVNNISVSLSSDINALKKRLSELSIGTMVYSAGDHINISSNGVISVTGISEVAETGSYNDLIDAPTDLSDFNNDLNVSDFPNDAGYITGDYIQPELFYSTTSYDTAAKTAVSAQASANFSLVDGRIYQVYLQGGNGGTSSTTRTMQLNDTAAVPMYLGTHTLAITGQFQMPSAVYYFIYHEASGDVEAYFQVRPVSIANMNGYQLLGNYITVHNTQYHFNRSFVFILSIQTSISSSVTLTDWTGSQAAASIIINGNTTAGLSNARTYLCYFEYDATNGHKLYTSTDWINFFGLTGDSGNAGKLDVRLYNHLTTWGGQYQDASAVRYGLNLNNSDIIGVNGFYTKDAAGGYSEGLNFYRDATHNDSMYARLGHFYFGSGVQTYNSKGSETTGAQNSDAILHAAGFVQNGNNVWDNSRVTNLSIAVPSTAGTYGGADYVFTAGQNYTIGLYGSWSSVTYQGNMTICLPSTSYTFNIFLFSSSGSMTGTTVKVQLSSTQLKVSGITGSGALGKTLTASIIDYNK